jgi:hypothetical protein
MDSGQHIGHDSFAIFFCREIENVGLADPVIAGDFQQRLSGSIDEKNHPVHWSDAYEIRAVFDQSSRFPRLFLGRFPLGNICIDLEHSNGFSVLAQLQSPAAGNDDTFSIPPGLGEFAFPSPFANHLSFYAPDINGRCGLQKLRREFSDLFVSRPAVNLLCARTLVRDVVVSVADQDGVVRQLQQTGLLAQCFLTAAPLGDPNSQLFNGSRQLLRTLLHSAFYSVVRVLESFLNALPLTDLFSHFCIKGLKLRRAG